MQGLCRGPAVKLMLQGKHLASSNTANYTATFFLKRCLHFSKIEVTRRSPSFLRSRKLPLESIYVYSLGSQSAIRWSSSNSGTPNQSLSGGNDTNLPEGYIPEPPLPLPPQPSGITTEAGTELVQQLNALGEPTLQSLGLASWYPSGLVQSALEHIHVGLDVPWWTAIVLGTVALRILVFPLVVLSQRNAANMHNTMPIVQKLQEKFQRARMSGNALEAARAGSELMDYMKKNNVSPLKNMLVPFAQLPIFVSVFVGIRQMANLPVESMTTGGLAWFTDLTVPDPFYALPLITMATFFVTLELGVDGVRAAAMTQTMRYIMRAMPVIICPFILNFPAGMLCYWMASNGFSLLQVLVLRINGLRTFFKIPQMVVHDPSITQKQKKPLIKGIKDSWKNSKTMLSVEERQKREAVLFKEAGLGSVQKTYSYDPTKVKNTQSTIGAKSSK